MAVGKEDRNSEQFTALKRKLEELGELINKKVFLNKYLYVYDFKRWHSETGYIVKSIYGEKSSEVAKFERAPQLPSGKASPVKWQNYRYGAMLRTAAELEAILSTPRKSSKQKTIKAVDAFIAHGGITEALNKVQTFIRALGINPLIVEDEPSRGLSVDKHVTQCLRKASFAVVLGTADDNNLKDGKLYPRPNVCIEIGRIRERFPNRVIYLLEEGGNLPTIISEKVYERFTQDNMEKAFLKIVRELRDFGILETGPIG